MPRETQPRSGRTPQKRSASLGRTIEAMRATRARAARIGLSASDRRGRSAGQLA